jgi:hypothetical protein
MEDTFTATTEVNFNLPFGVSVVSSQPTLDREHNTMASSTHTTPSIPSTPKLNLDTPSTPYSTPPTRFNLDRSSATATPDASQSSHSDPQDFDDQAQTSQEHDRFDSTRSSGSRESSRFKAKDVLEVLDDEEDEEMFDFDEELNNESGLGGGSGSEDADLLGPRRRRSRQGSEDVQEKAWWEVSTRTFAAHTCSSSHH